LPDTTAPQIAEGHVIYARKVMYAHAI
jgi:hypothetical protein